MSLEEFRSSLGGEPPAGLSSALLALWHDGRGEWHAAHEAVQGDEATGSAWVHAYLHRREGDPGNAGYWYRRADRPIPTCGLGEEWSQIAGDLLNAAKT
jgi:hypothetical protein